VTLASIEVDAYPASRVNNSQPHGIGRVTALAGRFAWNNLGRNVVFADEELRPGTVFDESVFDDDEPSQYDLDVHAILDVPNAGIVVTLNHLGTVRAFSAGAVWQRGRERRVAPLWTRPFAPDVERSVVVGDRLLGSRPREERAPGLLVGERLVSGDERRPLETRVQLEMCGMVTALGAFRAGATEYVVVGGNGQISLAPATIDGVGAPRWTVDVDFDPRTLLWDGALVWAAGSERATGAAVDDYDWDALHRGGFLALDPTDGHPVRNGRFPNDLAWGNGGVAVVLVPGALCGIGRRGELYVFDTRDAALLTTTAPIADVPLGIAHAAAVGDRVLFGFNRGGYRLHATTVPPIPPGRA
jgi:hypothetical protein